MALKSQRRAKDSNIPTASDSNTSAPNIVTLDLNVLTAMRIANKIADILGIEPDFKITEPTADTPFLETVSTRDRKTNQSVNKNTHENCFYFSIDKDRLIIHTKYGAIVFAQLTNQLTASLFQAISAEFLLFLFPRSKRNLEIKQPMQQKDTLPIDSTIDGEGGLELTIHGNQKVIINSSSTTTFALVDPMMLSTEENHKNLIKSVHLGNCNENTGLTNNNPIQDAWEILQTSVAEAKKLFQSEAEARKAAIINVSDTATSTATTTATPTETSIAVSESDTPTDSVSETVTNTATPTEISATASESDTPAITATPTETSATASESDTVTSTATPTEISATASESDTPTDSASETVTNTATPTKISATASVSDTVTSTTTPTETSATASVSDTVTSTTTPTPSVVAHADYTISTRLSDEVTASKNENIQTGPNYFSRNQNQNIYQDNKVSSIYKLEQTTSFINDCSNFIAKNKFQSFVGITVFLGLAVTASVTAWKFLKKQEPNNKIMNNHSRLDMVTYNQDQSTPKGHGWGGGERVAALAQPNNHFKGTSGITLVPHESSTSTSRPATLASVSPSSDNRFANGDGNGGGSSGEARHHGNDLMNAGSAGDKQAIVERHSGAVTHKQTPQSAVTPASATNLFSALQALSSPNGNFIAHGDGNGGGAGGGASGGAGHHHDEPMRGAGGRSSSGARHSSAKAAMVERSGKNSKDKNPRKRGRDDDDDSPASDAIVDHDMDRFEDPRQKRIRDNEDSYAAHAGDGRGDDDMSGGDVGRELQQELSATRTQIAMLQEDIRISHANINRVKELEGELAVAQQKASTAQQTIAELSTQIRRTYYIAEDKSLVPQSELNLALAKLSRATTVSGIDTAKNRILGKKREDVRESVEYNDEEYASALKAGAIKAAVLVNGVFKAATASSISEDDTIFQITKILVEQDGIEGSFDGRAARAVVDEFIQKVKDCKEEQKPGILSALAQNLSLIKAPSEEQEATACNPCNLALKESLSIVACDLLTLLENGFTLPEKISSEEIKLLAFLANYRTHLLEPYSTDSPTGAMVSAAKAKCEKAIGSNDEQCSLPKIEDSLSQLVGKVINCYNNNKEFQVAEEYNVACDPCYTATKMGVSYLACDIV